MNKYQILIGKGAYKEAILELNKLLELDAYNTEALTLLAKAQFKLKTYDQSISTYNSLINLLPDVAEHFSDRGLCHHMSGEYQLALKDFDKAVELEPGNAYRYSCRAFIKDYYKDYEGALKDYSKAIELDPEDAITYNNKGVLEEKLGYSKLAKESFDRSNEIQGIDLDKELEKINTSSAPDITLPKPEVNKLTFIGYIKTLRSVFTSRKGLKEFGKFLIGKK